MEHLEEEEDDDEDQDGDYVMKTKSNRKKRPRKDCGSNSSGKSRRKKMKLLHEAKFVKDDRGELSSELPVFVPIDVCLRDSQGFSALHHCVMTNGWFRESFENVTMMELLVNGTTERSSHFLQNEVDCKTPFKQELTEHERKETNFAKPTAFKSAERSIDLSITDLRGNDPMFYAQQQSSGKMAKCLVRLGANEMMKVKAIKSLTQKLEDDRRIREVALRKCYGESVLSRSFEVLSDAREWKRSTS